MIVPFELPEEFRKESAETIAQKMLAQIPEQFDKTEGGFIYDFVKPSALEASELIEFWLVLALQNMTHLWSKGKWLDYHAADIGLTRREGACAFGDLEVTTTGSVSFDKGFVFSVPSSGGVAAIDFETTKAYDFEGAGTHTVRVKAVKAGKQSNVKADTITIMKNPIAGVSRITNRAGMTGGAEPESDASLRQRIDDFYSGRQSSFVGNKKDYIRWAKEVPGVGVAHCIPVYDGPNTVKVVVADSNGEPATEELCKAVEKHIFGSGDKDLERLAPVGIVKYEVSAFETLAVDYSFEVTLEQDYTLERVEKLLRENLKECYGKLADDELNFGTLRYVEVSSVILNTLGVADFKHLRINGEIKNVEFQADKIPTTGEIVMSKS